MSKLITPMIIQRADGYFYMREVSCPTQTCSNYGVRKSVPIQQGVMRCPICRRPLNTYWKSLGPKLDYTDYFSPKTDKKMRRGKN